MSDDPIADYLRMLEAQQEQDPQLAIFKALNGYDWPNCQIADCQHKVCTWATEFYCAPHSLELLGPEEITRRYNETHPDTPWTESFPPGGRSDG